MAVGGVMKVEKVALGRKKVIVGIQLDFHAKELLDWALVKVADSGDVVIAIHVCKNPARISKEKAVLDGYLEDYEGLCSKKQITLTAHVLGGISRRKVFVREVTNHRASVLIVGICKHSALRGCTSVAKYCSKSLSRNIEVMTVHNGRVLFHRGSNLPVQGLLSDPKPSIYTKTSHGMKVSHHENTESDVSEVSRLSSDTRDSKLSSKEDGNSPTIKQHKGSRRFTSLPVDELTKQRPGWPLQIVNPTNKLAIDARKMSVVQWVMNLPCRTASDISGSNSPMSIEGNPEYGSGDAAFIPKGMEDILARNPVSCRLFNYDVLKGSTCDFSSGNFIGKGGCNSVYKGTLPDGRQVAVKALAVASSKGAWKDFIREFDIMTTVKHERIAPLIGICAEGNNLISVYDFMPKGSLEENLHGGNRKGNTVLPWESRYEIAIGIAEALNYLHSKCPRPVIHRDVKSSNIMLTDDLKPQLCDFGLATWQPTTGHFMLDRDAVGTFGYLAPEYFLYGRVSDKIDVYAFGVVLLELLSGRKPIDAKIESLTMWAKPRLESRDYNSLLDPNLETDKVDEAQMHKMALAASLSLTQAARLRPNMQQVLSVLKGEEWEEAATQLTNDGGFVDEGNGSEFDDEVYPESCAESHLSLALLDVNDEFASFGSVDHCSPLPGQDFLLKKRRWW